MSSEAAPNQTTRRRSSKKKQASSASPVSKEGVNNGELKAIADELKVATTSSPQTVAALNEQLAVALEVIHRLQHGMDETANEMPISDLLEQTMNSRRTKDAQLDYLFQQVNSEIDHRVAKVSEIINHEMNDLKAFVANSFEQAQKLQTSSTARGTRTTTKKGSSRKTFEIRQSLLYRMFVIEHYQTIFNIAIAVLVMFGLNLIIKDYFETGVILDISLITWAFEGSSNVFEAWLFFILASFSVIPMAHFTAISGNKWTTGIGYSIYALFQLFYFWYAGHAVMSPSHSVKPAAAFALLCEQSRISMKIHSYFREKIRWTDGNAYRPQSPIHSDYIEQEVKSFAYFLFCPTLCYRTRYPRTRRIRWDFVARRILEVLGVVYYFFVIFRMALPQFKEVQDPSKLTLKHFLVMVFRSMLPGMMALFVGFFLVLHSVQNLGAELTGFADRQFYEDWWNARDWSTYYRKWNGVVHDWIHSYLYLDLHELAHWKKHNAKLAAFAISAVIHEYIIACAMGFVYPVLLIMFGGPGILFTVLTSRRQERVWNIFMWLMLALGTGLLLVLYGQEFYARQHDTTPPVTLGRFVPRSWAPFLLGTKV